MDSRFERLGAGNDLLTARPQSLMEVRGPDGDVLDADGGDDTLRGESSFVLGGADTLSGGEGSDAFRINSTGGTLGQAVVDPAIITDFSHEDSLELRLGQLSGNTELTLTPIEDGTGTLVQIDGVTHTILQSATVVELGQIKLISDSILGERIVGTEGNAPSFPAVALIRFWVRVVTMCCMPMLMGRAVPHWRVAMAMTHYPMACMAIYYLAATGMIP